MNPLRQAANDVNLRRLRRWVQMAFFVLLVYGGWFAVNLGDRLPTFACGFNQPGRGGVCFLMPLQHLLAMNWKTLFGWAGLAVLSGTGVFLLWFLVLNKAWCGYACPLGTLQDWITALRTRLGLRAARYSDGQFRRLSTVKYALLALTLLIPLGIGGALLPHEMGTPFCDICPGRTLLPLFTGDASQLAIDFSSGPAMVLTALGMVVTGLFLAGSFVKKRFFCFFCPMSALHYLFSRPALLQLRKEGAKCTRCGDCHQVCDMDIRAIADDVTSPRILQDDCILCLKCVAACPEEGALKATFAGIPIFESTPRGFMRRMHKESKP